MAFKIFPTSIDGVQLPFNPLRGPLARLYTTDTLNNLIYPQDLASNPVFSHAIQISIFDYTTEFQQAAKSIISGIQNLNINDGLQIAANTATDIKSGSIKETIGAGGTFIGEKVLPVAQKAFQAGTYRLQKSRKLSTISLYMPDTLTVNYDSLYSDVSMTETLGIGGYLSSAIQDLGGFSNLKNMSLTDLLSSPAGQALAAKGLGAVGGKLGMNKDNLQAVLGQALGQVTNPQIQLLYRGIDLRKFQLEFVFTPKSLKEAETTKAIIETLIYYSSPGLAGSAENKSGQFLTPPQLFDIKFLFTGQTGVRGSLENVYRNAFSRIGLDFINVPNPTETISKGQEAKIFGIGECVLTNVSVDYAPNGWAAFEDGHPVQSRVTMNFQETQIVTKERLYNEGRVDAVRHFSTTIKGENTYSENITKGSVDS